MDLSKVCNFYWGFLMPYRHNELCYGCNIVCNIIANVSD